MDEEEGEVNTSHSSTTWRSGPSSQSHRPTLDPSPRSWPTSGGPPATSYNTSDFAASSSSRTPATSGPQADWSNSSRSEQQHHDGGRFHAPQNQQSRGGGGFHQDRADWRGHGDGGGQDTHMQQQQQQQQSNSGYGGPMNRSSRQDFDGVPHRGGGGGGYSGQQHEYDNVPFRSYNQGQHASSYGGGGSGGGSGGYGQALLGNQPASSYGGAYSGQGSEPRGPPLISHTPMSQSYRQQQPAPMSDDLGRISHGQAPPHDGSHSYDQGGGSSARSGGGRPTTHSTHFDSYAQGSGDNIHQQHQGQFRGDARSDLRSDVRGRVPSFDQRAPPFEQSYIRPTGPSPNLDESRTERRHGGGAPLLQAPSLMHAPPQHFERPTPSHHEFQGQQVERWQEQGRPTPSHQEFQVQERWQEQGRDEGRNWRPESGQSGPQQSFSGGAQPSYDAGPQMMASQTPRTRLFPAETAYTESLVRLRLALDRTAASSALFAAIVTKAN